MSRRFGRNQKRKLKAELTELRKDFGTQINHLIAVGKELRRLENENMVIINLVEHFCYNSAAIPPKIKDGDGRNSYTLPMHVTPNLYQRVSNFNSTIGMGILRTIDVYKLQLYI